MRWSLLAGLVALALSACSGNTADGSASNVASGGAETVGGASGVDSGGQSESGAGRGSGGAAMSNANDAGSGGSSAGASGAHGCGPCPGYACAPYSVLLSATAPGASGGQDGVIGSLQAQAPELNLTCTRVGCGFSCTSQDRLPNGTYRIELSAPGYQSKTVEFTATNPMVGYRFRRL